MVIPILFLCPIVQSYVQTILGCLAIWYHFDVYGFTPTNLDELAISRDDRKCLDENQGAKLSANVWTLFFHYSPFLSWQCLHDYMEPKNHQTYDIKPGLLKGVNSVYHWGDLQGQLLQSLLICCTVRCLNILNLSQVHPVSRYPMALWSGGWPEGPPFGRLGWRCGLDFCLQLILGGRWQPVSWLSIPVTDVYSKVGHVWGSTSYGYL